MNQIYEEKMKIDNTEMQIFTMFLLFKSWKKLWTLKNENCFRFLPLVVLQHTYVVLQINCQPMRTALMKFLALENLLVIPIYNH